MNEEIENILEDMWRKFPRMLVTRNPSVVGFRDEREDCNMEFINWLTDNLTTTFEQGRDIGMKDERERCKNVVLCLHDIDGSQCDCCIQNYARIDDPDFGI